MTPEQFYHHKVAEKIKELSNLLVEGKIGMIASLNFPTASGEEMLVTLVVNTPEQPLNERQKMALRILTVGTQNEGYEILDPAEDTEAKREEMKKMIDLLGMTFRAEERPS